MYLLKISILIFLILKCGFSAKILGIFPMPLYSHQSVFRPIWKELSLRGHQITVLTPNPLKDPNLQNLTEIDLSFSYKLMFEDNGFQYILNTEKNILKLMRHVLWASRNLTEEQFLHPEVQKLIKGDDHFDLMIVEVHLAAWFGLAKKFQCPIIGISSMEIPNGIQRSMGNLIHPVAYPSKNLPFGKNLNIFERILAVFFNKFEDFYDESLLMSDQEKIAKKYLNDNSISLMEIRHNISLMFSTFIPGFDKARLQIPTIVEINGLNIQEAKELPKDLQLFLDTATDGAIYFSFGSTVKSYLLDKSKRRIFLEAFNELPYQVIWKFEDISDTIPHNVKLINWTPQQDILRHPNVKLFITQGGIQSVEEAIHAGVPMLGIPFFGDQFSNVKRISQLRMGMDLNFDYLNKNILKQSINTIIQNNSYKANIDQVSEILKNPKIKPLENTIWWINYVLRYKGASHLKSPLADVPVYRYYLLDVFLFGFGFSFLIILLFLMGCKKCRKIINNNKKIKLT